MKKYTIKQRIGKGGMGEVYLAHDNRLNRDVAIKKLVIPGSHDWDAEKMQAIIARFQQEAQTAARLNHPNIVTIYQVIKSKGDYFIVMELLKGKSLETWLKRKRHFKILEVISIGMQICDALDYAHQAGVIHRDIKPDNIFLNDKLKIKLNDFGIAHVDANALIQTQIGQFIGTPSYSPPEQWDDPSHIDGRADIYAAGVVLYRLLAGKLPFAATNVRELQIMLRTANPTPLHQITPSVPGKLADAVMRAIEKDPQERFQTANAFSRALESVSDNKGAILAGNKKPSDHKTAVLRPVASDLNISASFVNISKEIHFDQPDWMLALFTGWKTKELNRCAVDETLGRLLDVPLYTDPFSGTLLIDKCCFLLFWKGHILQALNFETGAMKEVAFTSLPETANHITIYTADNSERTEIPLLLATILSEEKLIHDRLDSAFIDIAGFVNKLLDDKFTGAVRLRFPKGELYLGYCQGAIILLLQSAHLKMIPTETLTNYLSRLVQSGKFTADVYESCFNPLKESMRRFFQGASLKIFYLKEAKFKHTALLDMKKREMHPQIVAELKKAVQINPVLGKHREIQLGATQLSLPALLRQGFGYRFARFFLCDFFITLLSSGNKNTMKYVTTWIPSVTNIKLNAFLRDDAGATHFFDMIMTDQNDKIIHLVFRGANGDVKQIADFLESVKMVKKKYIKRGDIGGVSYVSDNDYTKEALAYYFEMTAERRKQFGLAYIDAFTGYKGFVRMGKNRGFHFNLFTETSAGFNLIAPVL